VTNDIKHIISERLLRMGLISQPIKNHSHAIELLAQDIMNHTKVSDDNFKDDEVELKVKDWEKHIDRLFMSFHFVNDDNLEDAKLTKQLRDDVKAFIADKIKEAYETGIDEGMYRIAAERILNKQAK